MMKTIIFNRNYHSESNTEKDQNISMFFDENTIKSTETDSERSRNFQISGNIMRQSPIVIRLRNSSAKNQSKNVQNDKISANIENNQYENDQSKNNGQKSCNDCDKSNELITNNSHIKEEKLYEIVTKLAALHPKQKRTGTPTKNERGKFECDKCKKEFSTVCLFECHQRIHKKARPFRCLICRKGFKVKTCLINHLTIHSGERPYQCEVCKFNFRLKSDLMKHARKHTGVRPFGCNICDKKFAVKSTLTQHLKIHDADRPRFACKKCEKSYTRRDHLKKHQLKHKKK